MLDAPGKLTGQMVKDRPGPEGQLSQRFPQAAQILPARLDDHVSIATGIGCPCSHKTALPTSRKDTPSAASTAAASTRTG